MVIFKIKSVFPGFKSRAQGRMNLIQNLLEVIFRGPNNIGHVTNGIRRLNSEHGNKFLLRFFPFSGPGYRLYYCWEEDVIVILLVGGNKETQEHDIELARQRMKFKE